MVSNTFSKYSLVLHEDIFHKLRLDIVHEGRVVSVYDIGLPYALRQLSRNMISYESMESELESFLTQLTKEQCESLDVRVRRSLDGSVASTFRGQESRVIWNSKLIFHRYLRVSTVDEQVEIQCVAYSKNKICKHVIQLGDCYAVDLEKGQLGRFFDVDGWQEFQKISSIMDDAKGVVVPRLHDLITIPTHEFNDLAAGFEGKKHWIIADQKAYEQDREVHSAKQYVLDVQIDPLGNDVDIHFLCKKEQHLWPPDPNLSLFYNFEHQTASLLFRTEKVRNLFRGHLNYFSHMESNSKESFETYIKKELKTDYIIVQKLQNKAYNFFKKFYEYIGQEKVSIKRIGKNWLNLKTEPKKEWVFYYVVDMVFGKDYSPFIQNNSFTLSRESFFKKLNVLKQVLETYHMAFTVNNKRVEFLDWEIEIDTKKDVNWFELHPEIRHSGESVSSDQISEIIKHNGYIEKEDKVDILCRDSYEAVKSLDNMFQVLLETDYKSGQTIQIPRLHILDWMSLKNAGVQVNMSADDEQIFNSLLAFEGIQKVPLPKQLTGKLRGYQKEGYYWLCYLYNHKLGACLADDMGLGKTIQTIAFLGAIAEGIIAQPGQEDGPLSHLIIVPASLIFNWKQEIERFYPRFTVYEYFGRHRKPDFNGKDIILTSYDILRRDSELFSKFKFNAIITKRTQHARCGHN